MKLPRSLETVLMVRLALVLAAAFTAVAGWLWLHLGHIEATHPQPIAHEIMLEFFTDIAWTVPIVLIVTLAFAAFTLRHSFAPLRNLSARAQEIRPDALDQRLPKTGLPAEVVPLVCAVNEMLDRVEAGFAAQRRFTANAAHELRTPLQLLASGIEALGEDCPRCRRAATPLISGIAVPQAADCRTQPLCEDVRRMSRLVSQLLAIARLDARTETVSSTTDLANAAAETLAFLAPLAVARSASVALERPPEPVTVRGNADLISDLVRNLVENALAVSPAGTEVTVAVGADGRLDVMDQGRGIAPAHRDRVFERFWRAPDAPAAGSGLGLAIVKEIADTCGAALHIGNAPGGGALVSVAFVRL